MKTGVNNLFNLKEDLNSFTEIKKDIEIGISFSGSTLWILFAAIFLASIGLNVNSTAVIIGAMLISPLMGPIIGIGIGASINDLSIIKKSFTNYFFSIAISLVSSAIYFTFTPLSEAYSELLARTKPNIYDVFVAIFGGFASIIAIATKNKGNILPGAAIATALMPPLCTAGFGIAGSNSVIFFGAIYLFIINSVFIALSAYFFARILNFPLTKLKDKIAEKRISRIILLITLITVAPSIYFGFEMIKNNKFELNANRFIQNEIVEKGGIVIKKNISYDKKNIELVLLGAELDSLQKSEITGKLREYKLDGIELLIQNGITNQNNKKLDEDRPVTQSEINQLKSISHLVDSLMQVDRGRKQIDKEIRLLFPSIKGVFYNSGYNNSNEMFFLLDRQKQLKDIDTSSINKWILNRLDNPSITIKYSHDYSNHSRTE